MSHFFDKTQSTFTREIPFGGFRTVDLPYPNNSIVTAKYSVARLLPELLFQFTQSIGYMWLLMIAAIDVVLYVKGWQPDVCDAVGVALAAGLSCFKSICLELQRRRIDRKVNSQPCRVWTGSDFSDLPSGSLRCGDLLYISNSETVPADVVLFATETAEGVCYVDNSQTLGSAELTLKRSVSDLQRFVQTSSLDHVVASIPKLQGMLKTIAPCQDFLSFSGQLRLARAPAASPLCLSNFILRGSSIYGTNWVICCVVGTGMESKVMLNAKASIHYSSKFETAMQKYTWVGMALTAVLVAVNMIAYFVTRSEVDKDVSTLIILESLLLFYRFVPSILLILFQISHFSQIHLINLSEFPLKLKPFSTLSHYGLIDYLIADKNTAFTTDKPQVHSLVFRDKIFEQCEGYADGAHSCLELIRRRKKGKVAGLFDVQIRDKEKKSSGDSNDHTYTSIQSKARVLIQGLQEPCGFRSLESQLLIGKAEDLGRMFECMVLCNTITQLEPVKAKNKFEEAMVNCGARFGFRILEYSPENAMLDIHGKRIQYNILASREYTPSSKRARVIIETSSTSQGVLYVKGSVDLVGALLNVQDELFDQIRVISLEWKQAGFVPILLACKVLDEYQLESVKEQIWKAQSAIMNVDSKIDSILNELEQGLHYLGIACIEDPVTEETCEGVRKLAQAGVKLWMVGNDSETESLASCMRSGFCGEETYVVPLKGLLDVRDSEHLLSDLVCEFIYRKPTYTFGEELSSNLTARSARVIPSFGRLMSELVSSEIPTHRHEYDDLLSTPFDPSSLNFMLLMDGLSLETVLSTTECQRLLSALLYSAKSVCLFSALPHQKAKLVRFLKHSLCFHPTILTFADNLSSFPMLNESDVRVGLLHSGNGTAAYQFHSKTQSLDSLAQFLLTQGRTCNLRYQALVLMILQESILMITVAAAYMYLCGFSSSSPVDLTSIWLLTFLVTKPLMVYIGINSADTAEEYAGEFPQLYTYRIRQFSVKYVLKHVLKSSFLGALLFGLVLINLQNAITTHGYTENSVVLSSSLSISIFLTITGSIIVEYMEPRVWFWVSVLGNCVLFIVAMVISNYVTGDMAGWMEILVLFPQMILKAVMPPVIPITVIFALHTYERRFQDSMSAHARSQAKPPGQITSLVRLWTPSEGWTPPKTKDVFERNRLLLTYKLTSMEENYQVSIFPELIIQLRSGFCVLAVVACISTVHAIAMDYSPEYLSLRLIFTGFCLCLLPLSFMQIYRKYYIPISKFSLVLFSVCLNSYYILSYNSVSEVAMMFPILSLLSFHVCYFPVLLLVLLNTLSFAIIGVRNVVLEDISTQTVFHLLGSILEVISVSISIAIAGYDLDQINRQKFEMLTMQENELQKADSILKYLLPEFVCTRVKDGVKFIADLQPSVHVLFCEICDFDHMIKDFEAQEVITLLNNVYEKFDGIAEKCGVTKVETVGKVYMACTGVKESEQDLSLEVPKVPNAQRLLYFAFELLSAMEQYHLPDGQPVRIKVGIHSGKVIAGVVGYHKPQFSLVGDTVNTASRMCSTLSEKNAVQVSDVTYSFVKGTFGAQFESTVRQVKGKGLMEVYLVRRDLCSRQLKAELEAPDVTPDLATLSPKPSTASFHGITVLRRNSVFEPPSGVLRSFQSLSRSNKKKCCHLFRCQFHHETHYTESLELRRPVALWGLLVISLTTILNTALELGELVLISDYWLDSLSRLILASTICTLALFSRFFFSKPYFSYISMCLLGLSTGVILVLVYLTLDAQEMTQNIVLLMLSVVVAVHFSGMRFAQLVPFFLLISVGIVANYVNFDGIEDKYLRMACLLAEIVTFFVYSVTRDVHIDKYFDLKEAVTSEIEKTEQLLRNLLPQHILDNMKLERNVTDYLCDATLLVADIVGFTAWSNEREPSEVIEMLSNLFTLFDQLCLKYKSYKVYTIGDCYIALGVSGKPDYRNPLEECVNIVSMALEMKAVIAKVNDDYFTNLDMRIGVHTGEIIGAVVGTNIVRYDIYGRDVLIAFKMEANSQPGLINVSEASRTLLQQAEPESFTFQPNTTVDISAIGAKVPCYFVSPTPV